MINAIDNGLLVTDLDANHQQITNLAHITPVPDGIVSSDDPRLTDPRAVLDGTVTDASVADDAAIDQAKINLNGDIPISWLGLDATHAAPGDLVEYLSNKGIADGYAGLDGSGKVPAAQLPDDIGTGTVTSVDLVMPAGFTVAGNPVTTAGVITVDWANVSDGTWFGNGSGVSAVPTFNTGPITSSMVPPLPASKIVTGTIDPARLPIAAGVGPTSSSGAVPDPGAVGNPLDYLGRDMLYHAVPSIGPSYQPKVDSPVIFVIGTGPSVIATISCALIGVSLFYQLTGMTDYVPLVATSSPGSQSQATFQVTVLSSQTLNVYGSKAGYNNSDIASYTNP